MPRIRNWHSLTFYRPRPDSRYEHIDDLFSAVGNWELIETHLPDLLRVVLSPAQKHFSAMLLKKVLDLI